MWSQWERNATSIMWSPIRLDFLLCCFDKAIIVCTRKQNSDLVTSVVQGMSTNFSLLRKEQKTPSLKLTIDVDGQSLNSVNNMQHLNFGKVLSWISRQGFWIPGLLSSFLCCCSHGNEFPVCLFGSCFIFGLSLPHDWFGLFLWLCYPVHWFTDYFFLLQPSVFSKSTVWPGNVFVLYKTALSFFSPTCSCYSYPPAISLLSYNRRRWWLILYVSA